MALDLIATQDALDTALDYEETGSVAKAHAVVTCCRRLLANRPEEGTKAASTLRYSVPGLERLLDDARAYIAAESDGEVTEFSLEEYR